MQRFILNSTITTCLALALTTACTPAALPTTPTAMPPTAPVLTEVPTTQPTATPLPPTLALTPTETPTARPTATAARPTASPLPPTAEPTAVEVSIVGNLAYSIVLMFEGYVVIPAGETLALTWEQAPSGGEHYEFYWQPQDRTPDDPNDDPPPVKLGTDDDPSDGVSVAWLVPPKLTGTLQAVTRLPNGTTVSSLGDLVVTSETPPPGCSLWIMTDPYAPANLALEPNASSPIFGRLRAGVYAQVLGYTADGWHQVDATSAYFDFETPNPNSTPPPVVTVQPPPPNGWLSPETRSKLFGSCDAVPLIEK